MTIKQILLSALFLSLSASTSTMIFATDRKTPFYVLTNDYMIVRSTFEKEPDGYCRYLSTAKLLESTNLDKKEFDSFKYTMVGMSCSNNKCIDLLIAMKINDPKRLQEIFDKETEMQQKEEMPQDINELNK